MERTILVTGANRGLGLHLVRHLINGGDHVWGAARQSDPQQLLELGPAGAIQLDMADEASIIAGARALVSQVDHLDVLINCAGVDARAFGADPDRRGPFDLDIETTQQVLAVNVGGPMALTRELRSSLGAGTNPVVVNISSQLGSMDVAARVGNDTSYCISKAAMNMLTVKSAAAMRDEGVAVVSMHPGWVSTDMGGSAASLTPDESASTIVSTLAGLSLADTGTFVNWDGSPHPW